MSWKRRIENHPEQSDHATSVINRVQWETEGRRSRHTLDKSVTCDTIEMQAVELPPE